MPFAFKDDVRVQRTLKTSARETFPIECKMQGLKVNGIQVRVGREYTHLYVTYKKEKKKKTKTTKRRSMKGTFKRPKWDVENEFIYQTVGEKYSYFPKSSRFFET